VTELFVLFVTATVKVCDCVIATVALPGLMLTETAGTTVIVAVADFEGSAWLVATTWYVPEVFGALYTPAVVIVPPALPSWIDQVTAVFVALATVAVNV
jgi:hypothetical protein